MVYGVDVVTDDPIVDLFYDQASRTLIIVLRDEMVETLRQRGFDKWEGRTEGSRQSPIGWYILSESGWQKAQQHNKSVSSLLGRLTKRPNELPLATDEGKVPEEDLKEALEMLKKFSLQLFKLYRAKIHQAYYSDFMPSYSRLADEGTLIYFDQFLKKEGLPQRPKDLLLYLLLVEETSHLALPLEEDNLTIELATFLNMARAYYKLTKEEKDSLKTFAQENNQQERLLVGLPS
jgi:hypothetical protein